MSDLFKLPISNKAAGSSNLSSSPEQSGDHACATCLFRLCPRPKCIPPTPMKFFHPPSHIHPHFPISFNVSSLYYKQRVPELHGLATGDIYLADFATCRSHRSE